MKEELDAAGIQCVIVPRKEEGGSAISASKVRQAIKEGNLEACKSCRAGEHLRVLLLSPEAEPVIQRIRRAEEVIHY